MLVLALPPRPLDRDAKAEFGIPVRLEACMSHSNSGNSGTCATFEPPVLRFCPGFPLLSWLSSHFSGGLPTNEARFPKPEKSSFEQQQANLNDQTKITAERSRKNRTFFRYCTASSPPPWLTLKRMRRTNRHRSSPWYVANPRGPVPRHARGRKTDSIRQVVMKIVKHCSSSFPTTATGSLVGMDSNGVLEITNAFPFPTVDVSGTDGHQSDPSSLAAAAPRAKANIAYQNEMIRHLKEVNVDANNVGWYTSATMGNFISLSFIENQYHYQRDNDKTVALVHDVSRSSQGALSLRAFRLSTEFMAAYKEGKFTTERSAQRRTPLYPRRHNADFELQTACKNPS